jgi:transcriptional regulator with XRE-family HTH domain
MVETLPIGQKINKWRKEKGLTLKQLADECDLTASYISQVEHEKASPSIASLRKIAQALGVRTIDFFADEIINDPKVLKENQWTQVTLPRWEAHVRQLVRLVGSKRMQPFYTVIPPKGGTREKPYAHEGEEFGIVLEGEMVMTIGNEVYEIGPMTSFYYSSLLPHSWKNKGSKPCRVVWVVSPPSW